MFGRTTFFSLLYARRKTVTDLFGQVVTIRFLFVLCDFCVKIFHVMNFLVEGSQPQASSSELDRTALHVRCLHIQWIVVIHCYVFAKCSWK